METEIIKVALTQGIWAALSIVLIFYILKNQEKRDTIQDVRDQKYQEIIAQLTDRLSTVKDLQGDILEMKNLLSCKK